MADFEYELAKHPRTGWDVAHLRCTNAGPGPASTEIAVAPGMGLNLLSLRVDGQEYLVDAAGSPGAGSPGEGPEALRILGTPILYPMPNRVRDGRFTFDGRTFAFPPNNGPNFIHGLVRDRAWQLDEPIFSLDEATLSACIRFRPGADGPGRARYDLFPIQNSLEVTFALCPGGVRLQFLVRNEDERQRLPFGLAIHPYFQIIGRREDVRLQVPAPKWMEAENLLPTGRLVDVAGTPRDLNQPRSLAELDLDDVFWGLTPERPQVIYYDRIGKKVTLSASDLFTHSVVFTPQQPFFCVENQSCSTDAHNLYARGLQEAAHLTILDPGESLTAWVDIKVSDQ